MHKIFSKEKTEKNKAIISLEGFSKTGFFRKILPGGWRFFEKPEGLESVFLITRKNKFAFFFSVFCF
ncbi:hypothetical protein Q764_10290 [Flavobacterium suncheonense GH29-5 = DSM 17707]|uniref:Uncharacterized protein n=1 Tax=Flavobacterium suncheonense GH29-5 = DSM 17707 TaxID=1121899 RepID=A0A0A2MKZ4_9FLAO|nr:hypothetical protein Q764_10290 [Flavobacterium suncheonense GH29-5 = DSM 17707]